jgi:thioredoxin-related protein
MKKILLASIVLLFGLGLVAFKSNDTLTTTKVQATEEGIKWMTWEEAMKLQATAPRKIMVDVYTDWCGWCKRMDKEAFSDAQVGAYVNTNFYAVKLDAEQKADILFGDKTFKYVSQGRGGYHEFAAALLDGQMGYPTVVYLNEKFERTVVSPGYKKADVLMKELKFTGDNHYLKGSWDDYMSKSE